MRKRTSFAGVLAVLATACSLAPDYKRPETEQPAAAFKELGDWKIAAPADASPRGAWWKVFHDPGLDTLEEKVGSANPNLQAALARLEQARAQTRIAASSLLPTVDAQAHATRQRVSLNSPSYIAGKPNMGDDFLVGASLSYEIDLFGRVRNTVAAARAGEQASEGDVAALDLSIHAELATDYFTLRGLDAQQGLLDQTVKDYERALDLTQNLYQGGAGVLSDVQQATAQLETARTQAEDTRLRRAQMEHAIAVLTGMQPSLFHIDTIPEQLDAPLPAIDPGIPSELLERRPDVSAAERRVAAANATIGVARAAYFPVFTLTGGAGFESVNSANWLTAPSRYWAIGPQGVLTIFDAGLHQAQNAAARASYDEQVANYRNSVLTAFQDVEDNLAALRQLEKERVSQAAAVAATQGALDQANYRYRGGLVTYLEVVSTENAALSARLAAVDILTRRMTASVLLVKALGGDWNAPASRSNGTSPTSAAENPG
jgi:NodT family efflux transporter outer membrane factor (OMF) lipoprotein